MVQTPDAVAMDESGYDINNLAEYAATHRSKPPVLPRLS
jgi:hypothetical protein